MKKRKGGQTQRGTQTFKSPTRGAFGNTAWHKIRYFDTNVNDFRETEVKTKGIYAS